MTATVPQPVVPLHTDSAGRLAEDLACIKCGYNLRGADAEGACPECGLAVGRSARGHWLRYCDPGWLASIWQGLNLLGIVIACVVLLVMLERAGWVTRGAWGDTLAMIALAGAISTAAVLGVVGFWKATRPDPAKLGDEWPVNARRAARVLLIGSIVVIIGLPIVIHNFGIRVDERIPEEALPAAMLAGLLAILWHARGLARRIPNRPLQWLTVMVVAVLAACGAWWHIVEFNWFGSLSAIDSVYVRFVPRNRGPISTLYSFKPIGQWGVAIGLTGTLVLLAWYWRAMKREADEAKRTWARG
jgi:hypothetical protein